MKSRTSTRNKKWLMLVNRLARWSIGLALIYFGDGWKGEWPALIVGLIFFISGFLKPRGCIDGTCEQDD